MIVNVSSCKIHQVINQHGDVRNDHSTFLNKKVDKNKKKKKIVIVDSGPDSSLCCSRFLAVGFLRQRNR
jgi:hypothetical protein